VTASWRVWAGPDTNSRAAGTAAPASSAAPSQETSITALVEEAAVWSKPAPSPADRTGNALVAIGRASTAYGTKNICQP
jgi:hypothetical protein